MKRTVRVLLVFELFLRIAAAQTPLIQAKLSPHLQMLLSGDPNQVATARGVLPIRSGRGYAEPVIPAFIRFQGDGDALRAALGPLGVRIHSTAGNVAIADIPVRTLQAIASHPNVIRISEGKPVKTNSDHSVPETGANSAFGWGVTGRPSVPPWSGNTGKNAIIGIVDSGIDLSHPDFRDSNGRSRILALWDQTATNGESPSVRSGLTDFTTGNECRQLQINAVNQKPNLGSVFDGAASVGIAVGDFDQDGYLDEATTNGDGSVSVFLGTAVGFNPTRRNSVGTGGPTISFLAMGDFNSDGIPDLVGVVPAVNQIVILLGNGDGTFMSSSFYNVGNRPTSVAVGDLNGDGFTDIVVTNYYDGTVSVFLGNGKGTFRVAPNSPFPVWDSLEPNSGYPQGNFPSGVAMADFDGDGKLDMAVANWGRRGVGPSDALSILLGFGDGTFKPAKTIDTTHFGLAIAVGDFNRDGNPDVALQSYSHFITVLLGNGDGTFAAPVDYDAGGVTGLYIGLSSLVAYDRNGDGRLDLATLVLSVSGSTGNFYNAIATLHGNGNGTFQDGVASTTSAIGTNFSDNTSGLAAGNFNNVVCTEVDLSGHGTHVAGIAAGNGSATNVPSKNPAYRYIGMAPEANLIVVKHAGEDSDILQGIDYIQQTAARINPSLPVVINLSLGGVLGPHDGTALFDEEIDKRTGPGRIIVAAAGNEANRGLHVSGTILNGNAQSAFFNVPPGLSSISLDLWYPGADNIGVQVAGCMPAQLVPVRPVYWSQTGTTQVSALPGCGSTVEITASPAASDGDNNGDHGAHIHVLNPQAGPWAIKLSASGCGTPVCVANGKGGFDVWASDTCDSTNQNCLEFLDGIDPGNHVDPMKTLNSPATATTAIAVASYVTKNYWTSRNGPVSDLTTTMGQISLTSGRGPRRGCSNLTNPHCDIFEGASQKPEIAAPGVEIMSSYAAGTPTDHCSVSQGSGLSGDCLDRDSQHVLLRGSSMAAPHVTGGVALLLSQYGMLTVDQVVGALSNARSDAFTGGVPNNTWGFGKLAVDGAIQGQGHTKIVPNVVNMSQFNAQSTITAAGLNVGTISRGPSSSPVGTVISQSPAAGSILALGAPVNLVLSGIRVPDVTGMDLAQAQSALTAVLLNPGTVTYQSSATIPVKQIISEDPLPGTFLTLNSPVNLVASGTIVPSVIGQTLSAAQSAIIGGHLTVGTIAANNASTMPVGSIDNQNPTAGSIVAQGTPVALVVSGNLVPNVVGLTQAAAQSALSAASLNLGTASLAFSFTMPAGNVISQSPVAGSILGSGAAVNVVVSQGPSGTCATNVTASVTIMSTGFSYSVATKKYAKMVTITNSGASTITGPILLVFDSLSSSAAVYNPTSTTQCVPPLGSPYVTIAVGSLGPGSSAAITVLFTNSSPSIPITYTNRVMAGSSP